MSRKWHLSPHYHFHILFPMSIVQKALLHARAKTKTSINQLFTKYKALLLGLKGLLCLLIQIHEIAYIHNELYIIMTASYHITFHFFFPLGFLSIPSPRNSCSEHDSFYCFCHILQRSYVSQHKILHKTSTFLTKTRSALILS